MDTPSSVPTIRSTRTRRLRIAVLIALILAVQGGLAYLLTWIEPPKTPLFLPIRVTSYPGWFTPKCSAIASPLEGNEHAVRETKRADILAALDTLASRGKNEPVVVHLSGIALHGETGNILIVPSDGTPDDPASWLPLRDILEKLAACPSQHKLLLFEWSAPSAFDRIGQVYHDIAAQLPSELEAVPDEHRLVVAACSPGQTTHHSNELGQSVFAHYVHQGLLGHADGYGDARDSRISVKELANFVQARVDRWARHNRGERQTPTLLGHGEDFTLVIVPSGPRPEFVPKATPTEMPESPHRRAKITEMIAFGPPANIEPAKKILDVARRNLDQQLFIAKPGEAERFKKRFVEEMRAILPPDQIDAAVFAHVVADPRVDPATLRMFDQLLHPTPATMPRTALSLKLRQLADLAMRVEVQAWPRDAVEALLRATDLSEKAWQQTPHLPGYFDLLKVPTLAQHHGEIRLLARGHADAEEAKRMLANAAEQFDAFIKGNENWGKWERQLDDALAELPWYLETLEELPELREPWDNVILSARTLADTLRATDKKQAEQIVIAEKHASALDQLRQSLHVPFGKEALAGLEQRCNGPKGDAVALREAKAILSVAAPVLHGEDRASLRKAIQSLSGRLNDETLTLDRQDDEAKRVTLSANTTQESDFAAYDKRTSNRLWRHVRLLTVANGWRDLHVEANIVPMRDRPTGWDGPTATEIIERWGRINARLHRATFHELRDQWAKQSNWRDKERLAWIMPPLTDMGQVDQLKRSPTLEHLRTERNRRDRWLAEHQRYLAREYANLAIDSPGIVAARTFYKQAVEKLSKEFDGVLPSLTLQAPTAVDPLTERKPYSFAWFEVTRHVPKGGCGPVELRYRFADDAWLEISPDTATLAALSGTKEAGTVTTKVPIKITRKPKAERSGLSPPLGFLIEAHFEGRIYHQVVNVPIAPSADTLQILVSADPEEPLTTLSDIRVRPGKVKQPHYVYLRNLTNRAQKVVVEIHADKGVVAKSKVLTVEADAVRKVNFDEVSLSQTANKLEVRVLDADRAKLLQQRTLRVEVLEPRDYVQVAAAAYQPGQAQSNRWTAQVQAIKPMVGPAIAAQLVLPMQRIPGLMSVGGGTMQVELPANAEAPRLLFAERLNLLPSIQEEGPVYLHIDGVPRALIYRTTFARGGEVTQPKLDLRPAVRIAAPPCVMAGVNCLIDVEVDNAPPSARLEVAFGHWLENGKFRADVVREFVDAKKRSLGIEATKNALVFDATLSDWTATFDTRGAVGPRALQARLIDATGKEIATATQSLVIDDSPPIARMLSAPAQVKRGSVMQIHAQGFDPESGIAQVVFFLGRPDKGEIPLSAVRFKGVAGNRENTQWSAPIQIPADHKGPLAVSVQIVNHAGLASVDTITLEVTDRDPVTTGLGEIRGNVTEGPRPQPNLLVTLVDQTGREIQKTKTHADGSYAFTQVAPGRYRVICVKPESQRRAVMNVFVEPNRTVRIELALML